MLNIEWVNERPEEITVDNYFRQKVRVYDDDKLILTVYGSEQCLDSAKCFFQGKIKAGMEIILNNRIHAGKGAEAIAEEYNLDTWES